MKAKITKAAIDGAKAAAKPYEIRDTNLAGFMARVQPSGRKTFIVEYARGKRMTIGKADVLTPSQAREKARAIIGQYAAGEDPAAEKRKRTNGDTLRTFIEKEYRPWTAVHHRHPNIAADQVLRVFGDLVDKPLSGITASAVDRIRTSRRAAGIKPATVNRDTTALRGALSQAVRTGFLADNPLSGLSDLDVDTGGTVRYLSDDEARRLREALAARDAEGREARIRTNEWRAARHQEPLPSIPADGYLDHLTPLVLLSLNTGARRGEMFALEWTDVNFDLRQMTLRGEVNKSNRTRHIPLNDEALAALEHWHRQAGHTRLVFEGRDGQPIDNVRKAWANILEAADITGFRWHDLRHTFASWLVMRGIDLNTVRELLGHSDIETTLRYAHLAPAHKAAAVAVL